MRTGFSMIELIVSIVVMGIVVATLPMILLQTQNNLTFAMQQEAIMSTKSKIGYILAYDWDANSYESTSGFTRVLNTDGTAANNAFDRVVSIRRVGHIEADGRQRLRDDLAAPTPKGNFATNSNLATGFPDIDDFDSVVEATIITAEDYDMVLPITLTPTIEYVTDNPAAGNYNAKTLAFTFTTGSAGGVTNIKMIQMHTTGANIDLTLRAYASNIGESRPLERAW